MIDSLELEDRISKCEKILASDKNSQIFAALADAYRKKGDVNKAMEVCVQGLKIHPKYASARVVMAKIYMARKDYDSAKKELNLAIESSGRSRAIDILDAEILIHSGRHINAKAILDRLYASEPEDETVKNLLAMLAELKGEQVHSPAPSSPANDHPPERELSLADMVGIIKVMPRVLGVVAINDCGLVLEGRFDGSVSHEIAAALSRGIFEVISIGCNRINLGVTREILIESPSSKLWIFNKGNILLAIFARDDVSIGSLKLKIDELSQKLESHAGTAG